MNRIRFWLDIRRRAQDDRGIALIVVIALMAIVGIALVTMVSVAIYENNASGRDRQRSGAVMTAEGQVDSLIATVQAQAPATLPCGVLTPADVSVQSDTMSITNTVTYYNAAGVVVSCAALPTTEVTRATISSTSTSDPIANQAAAVRTVETQLALKPTYANGLTKAIFGDAGVELANHADIFGQAGQPDADLYTNGNVTCNNNQHYYGSIYAQGTVTMSNTCTVEVDVHSKKTFTASNPGVTVKGKVLVSSGQIILGKASLGQQARASGTVTGNICATTGKCFASQAVADPPYEGFPEYNWDATTQAAYAAKGYTVKNLPDGTYTCGMFGGAGKLNGKVDNVARWIVEELAKPGSMGKTVVYANCPGQKVNFQGVDLVLESDLAIFSKGGFSFSNKSIIKSADTTHRLLYLVHPFNSVATHPCMSEGITLDNQVTIEDTVSELLYSPCSIRKANNSTHYGQIYSGGKLTIDNKLTMYYEPLPILGLVSATAAVESYTVDILYKRETMVP